MSRTKPQKPILIRLYRRYLKDEDAARFIRDVSTRYTTSTLQRLAQCGVTVTRRAAVLALGFVSGYETNVVLGRALHDRDRGVRILAEDGIREIWCRAGNDAQRQQIAAIIRLIDAGQFEEAISSADELIHEAPWFAEAWNQRAVAYYHLEMFEESIRDSQQALELNAYHFAAAVGMGNCYLELSCGHEALDCYQRALKLNPDMETVRAQVRRLKQTLKE